MALKDQTRWFEPPVKVKTTRSPAFSAMTKVAEIPPKIVNVVIGTLGLYEHLTV